MSESLSLEDIGPNILIHLTHGIYPDPRDSLREYIQNAVDSNAAEAAIVVVAGNEALIEDNGEGMDHSSMILPRHLLPLRSHL